MMPGYLMSDHGQISVMRASGNMDVSLAQATASTIGVSLPPADGKRLKDKLLRSNPNRLSECYV
jgi:hypothetical protein